MSIEAKSKTNKIQEEGASRPLRRTSLVPTLVAKIRTDMRKSANRRLRLADLVPAIVYGAGKDPVSITLEQKELRKVEVIEAFYSSILELDIDGTVEQVILKDIQRHAFKELIQHLDLLRVDVTTKLQMVVPIHFINANESRAVKEGGVVSHIANDVEISCMPSDLPSFIEVDLSAVEMGVAVHLSDITLPTGVESIELAKGEAHNLPIAIIAMPKQSEKLDIDTEDETETETETETSTKTKEDTK
ncbi:MAG: 50S ribosomal protein L25/general stress protein Ctc [Psychromonas sp.]|nr:50S ribosomal protein L25/general stress protein Ctc [Psychromonas sp.]